MGCCVSSDKDSRNQKEAHLEPILENRAPPPSAEEETVKEVLSETPKLKASPKARIFITQQEEKKTQIEKPVFVKIKGRESLNFNVKSAELKPPINVVEGSASEDVSEICSVSVSESVSSITDRRDEEEEVRPRRVFRSPARNGSGTRKLDQSPARRNMAVNGGSRPDPIRKDPGESSGRRSRSPAMNRSVMGRSPSGRKTTNQSPGRVRIDPGESGNSKKMEQHEGKWPSSNNNGPNESLENPLVSLECFIFL